ncbi:MAG: LmbU family transcriptional regulator [Actinomycetota bacterium]|nr:LmbU family transcriptional regulator [Actinomycetota bacterium]
MDDADGAPRTEDSGLRERSPDDGSEFTRSAVAEELLLTRSMLDFGDDWTDLHVRRNGLSLPEDMPFDSWRELGCRVALVANCSAWWLGDWLVYGEEAYDDRYEQAIADTELGYQTLRNYAWVARKLPMSRRRDTLSFGHHAEVAALPNEEQDAWLARAEQLSWSSNKLRRALRAAKVANRRASGDETSAHTRALKIDVPSERHDRWQSAAQQTNCSVADWIIATLDRAASEELNT